MLNLVFPYPVLHMDEEERVAVPPYEENARFNGTVTLEDGNVVLTECQLSTNTLVGDLVLQKKAQFGSMLSTPATMFRNTTLFDEEFVNSGEMIEITSKNLLPDQALSGEPAFSRPIVALGPDDVTVTIEKKHGLRSGLLNKKIEIPARTIIALAPWIRFGDKKALLSIESSNELRKGQIFVSKGVSDVDGSYRFYLRVSKSLYRDMQRSPKGNKHRESIFTHAMSRALEKLVTEHNNEGDKLSELHSQYPNLCWLSEELKSLDGCMCDWTSSDFEPEKAATALRGHDLSKVSSNDDD